MSLRLLASCSGQAFARNRAWEQKLAVDVLGIEEEDGESFSVPASQPNNQVLIGMKSTPENERFQGGAMGPDESRFEKLEIGPFRPVARCAHFGRNLQKIFPLPSNGSEPDNVRILLRKIKAKLDGPPVPGDG